MSRPTLVIANKNYSSWSMRGWVLLRALGIDFEEVQLKFHTEDWRKNIGRWSPAGLVPVLWLDGEPVWDTLAIAEGAQQHPAAHRPRRVVLVADDQPRPAHTSLVLRPAW